MATASSVHLFLKESLVSLVYGSEKGGPINSFKMDVRLSLTFFLFVGKISLLGPSGAEFFHRCFFSGIGKYMLCKGNKGERS